MPWPVPPLPLDNPEEAQQYIERLTLQTQQLCEASFSDDDEPPATKPTRIRLRVPETQLPTDTPQVEKPVDDLHHSAQQTTDPAMVANTRRSARNSNHTQPSGSEYSGAGSAHSGSVTSQSPAAETRSNRRARATGKKYDYDDDEFDDYAQPASQPVMTTTTSSRGRTIRLRNPNMILSDDDDDDAPPRAAGTRGGLRSAQSKKRRNSFIDDEENGEEDEDDPEAGYNTRSRKPKDEPKDDAEAKPPTRSRLKKGSKRRTARQRDEEGDYVDDGISHSEQDLDADGSVDHDDPVPSTPEEPSRRPQSPEEAPGYGLRKRTAKVNYALPPPLALEEIGPGINGNSNGGVDNVFLNGASNKGKGKPLPKDYRKVIPWGVGPRFGGPAGRIPPRRGAADDSDSDVPGQTPKRPFGAPAGGAGGLYPAGGMGPNELAAAAAGTPSNLGKIGTDTALADADPLGVNQNVTFDEVGGLDDHIRQLEEMVRLPLLYPEIFQQHHITPPRGVLFHGPPGTGKTLVARALAASSRSGGRSITFFMRKGADALSKWVGEAERQLRLLFEEARACQPSIIFFDEIDGLAPVRSSKQDQIHASIVSTLLALMDGMDGRGQVIVIGATNRPDAIDPALRRPGRFDRELYFPLPSLPARQRILGILTKDWNGWEEEKGEETRAMLAKATKGYGGADLRALATEATLNAIQRRYPQIYKSKERLLVDPKSIIVQARDFMIALKKMVPSSARSAASEAKALPPQLVPLLGETFEEVKQVLDKALPLSQQRSILEEAEYEDDEADGSLERELMLQAMETLRVHRPRVALCGPAGMGQAYIGAAALHHMEGTQVQSLDLATLMSDSTRTVEAAIVQLFVEAKRHKPSIVYIPSLISWCGAVTETARTTVRTMLDSLSPTDPLLLLAIVDGDFASLPKDVRAWFGHNKHNRILLTAPSREKREEFFKDLLSNVERPPTGFPDGVPRKKRVLEVLPIAPPLPPRQPTAAEMAAQLENDERMKAMLTARLGPILQDIKRKFKRFTKSTRIEYDLEDEPPESPDWTMIMEAERALAAAITAPTAATPEPNPIPEPQSDVAPVEPVPEPNGEQTQNTVVDADGDAAMESEAPQPAENPGPPAPPSEVPQPIPRHKYFSDMDLEKMHAKLYYEGYLTPKEFLDDILKIVGNAEVEPIDNERLFKAQAMYHTVKATLFSWEPQFALECERMAQREHERRAQRKEKTKVTTTEPDRASPNAEPYAPGTRRSARANGLEPEIPYTPNPERKLKRSRTQGEQGGSQTDGSPSPRSPKRAKTASDIGTPPEGQEGPVDNGEGGANVRSVRFANELTVPGHASAPHVNGTPELISTPVTATIPELEGIPATHTAQAAPVIEQDPPMLLSAGAGMYAPMTGVEANGVAAPPLVPTLSEGGSESVRPSPAPSANMHSLASILIHPPDTEMHATPPPPAREPTPPPPHPDFHLDENILTELKNQLLERTHNFTVEQLEQLRAACLTTVWKLRSSWDRDNMVRELMTVVDDFVNEVLMEEASSP